VGAVEPVASRPAVRPTPRLRRELERVGAEEERRTAVLTATARTAFHGLRLVEALHDAADALMVPALERIAAVSEQPRSETAQALVGAYLDLAVQDRVRHSRGIVEAGAYAIAQVCAGGYDLDPEEGGLRGLLLRIGHGHPR
jgi:hypothetical protein